MKNLPAPRYLIAPLMIVVFAVSYVFAQPDDELERVQFEIATLKTEIAAATRQLSKAPAHVELREKRGDLYVRLYRAVFATHYDRSIRLSDDLNEIDLVSKAINDYTHVVWVNHGPSELFLKRGTAYALRWYLTTRIDWTEATRGNRDPKWNDIVDWEDRTRQRSVFTKFISNADFDLAISDLERSSRGRNDPAVEVEAELAMGKIYLERTRSIPYGQSEYARELGDKAFTEYSVWKDYDDARFHLFKSVTQPLPYKPLKLVRLPLTFSQPGYRDALYEKIQLAIAYGGDEDALAIYNMHRSWVRADSPNDEFACKYYTTVYQTEIRRGKYDSVIDYFGNVTASDPQLDCDAAHEPRGDAYFAKGEYANAIADYTVAATSSRAPAPTLRLYVSRAKAYLKLGEKEKALADLNTFLGNAYGEASAEDLLLRASIFRELGNAQKAADDERMAHDIESSNAANAENRKRVGLVYGKVVMRTGKALSGSAVSVVLNYADGTTEHSSPPIDERGRFVFRNLKPQPFYITAFSETERKGVPRRYYARTRKFPATRSHIGPLLITLSGFEKK